MAMPERSLTAILVLIGVIDVEGVVCAFAIEVVDVPRR